MAYTNVSDLKTYLGITQTTDDTLLGDMIGAAQAMIDTHCKQTFEATGDTTRRFYAYNVDYGGHVDGRDLVLDAPLCAITSVTNGDGVVVSASDYITEPRNATPYYALRLTNNSNLRWTYTDDVEIDTIAVVGRWAYSVSAPADVAQACKLLAGYMYRRRNNALDLDRAVVVSDATIQPLTIPGDILTILRPYRRVV